MAGKIVSGKFHNHDKPLDLLSTFRTALLRTGPLVRNAENPAKYKQKENAVPTIFFSHRPSKKPRLSSEHHRQEQSQKEVLLCKS